MDDKLARRLRYPRPLEDGGYAVQPGFNSWYRLEAEEFNRFVHEFSSPSWFRLANIVFTSLWLLSLFVFPTEWTSPTLYFVLAAIVSSVIWPLVHNKRFRSTFPQAKQVLVSRGPWFIGIGLSATAPLAFLLAAGSLFLGWGLADRFPDAFIQFEYTSGFYGYHFFSGFSFATWIAALGILLYYRATRGCRLTYDNLIRTEGPASFEYTT